MIDSAFIAFTSSKLGMITVTLAAVIVACKTAVIDRMVFATASTALDFRFGRRNDIRRHVGRRRRRASGGGRT